MKQGQRNYNIRKSRLQLAQEFPPVWAVPVIPQEAAKCPKAVMEGLLKQEVSLNF